MGSSASKAEAKAASSPAQAATSWNDAAAVPTDGPHGAPSPASPGASRSGAVAAASGGAGSAAVASTGAHPDGSGAESGARGISSVVGAAATDSTTASVPPPPVPPAPVALVDMEAPDHRMLARRADATLDVEVLARSLGTGGWEAPASGDALVQEAIDHARSGGRRLTCCSFLGGLAIRVHGAAWSGPGTLDEWHMTLTWIDGLVRTLNYRDETWWSDDGDVKGDPAAKPRGNESQAPCLPRRIQRPRPPPPPPGSAAALGIDFSDPSTYEGRDVDWDDPRLYEEAELPDSGEKVAHVWLWEESSAVIARISADALAMEDVHGSGRVVSPRVVVDIHDFAAAVYTEMFQLHRFCTEVRAACDQQRAAATADGDAGKAQKDAASSAAESGACAANSDDAAKVLGALDAVQSHIPDPASLAGQLDALRDALVRSATDVNAPVPADVVGPALWAAEEEPAAAGPDADAGSGAGESGGAGGGVVAAGDAAEAGPEEQPAAASGESNDASAHHNAARSAAPADPSCGDAAAGEVGGSIKQP